ncbi:sensor histidine kinase [Pseudonocardia sichuanensis]|uniref:histidine kinase n=1 Tax=Pseudonocardia kunmingensis TaxID=630975 RepID=A0A543E1P6_9PSEU|nr:sensor histidine kinase [Pseudonocardia kunmingensis]TQM15503.1 signal transduction histidine kinase [Pseudonocardia kunmingensis]
MNRALAVLTAGAYLALALGSLGSADPVPLLLLGAVFTVLGTAGFLWVRRRGGLGWAVAYVTVQLALAVAVFANDPGVGATLLLVALVCQCVLLLPLPGTAVVVALVPFLHAGMPWEEALREGSGLLAAVLFAAVVTELLRREQETRRALAEAHAQLRDYASQAERLATAQERNRVARDIHDGLGHVLTVVQMQVKAARAVLRADVERADAVLAKAQQQSEEALAEVRRSVGALREPRSVPPLREALRVLAEETSAAGVPTELAVRGVERAVADEIREALFRAAQEGLTNVRKHARATRADLVLDYADDAVRVEVRDDGTGMADGATTGFGLLGLRERAAHLGGRLQVEPAPDGGCTVRMEVPG